MEIQNFSSSAESLCGHVVSPIYLTITTTILIFGYFLDSKQEKGEFSVKLQDVFEAHKSIMKNKITMDDDNESSKLVAAYNKFLSNCNAVDFADILQRVKTTFIVDSDVKDKFQTLYQFVAVGNPKTQLEVR